MPQERVLLLENIHPNARHAFESAGYPVESRAGSLPESSLREALGEVSILGIRSKTQITESVLAGANKLAVIGAFCIGTDKINLKATAEAGIGVFNAPFSNTRSVAELALGHMIGLLRGVADRNREMHGGVWNKSSKGAAELRDKTLGIIGYGNIGSQLGTLAEILGMKVIYFNSSEKQNLGNAKKMHSMQEVLEKADVVSVHVSGKRPQNDNLISAREFESMKQGAIFLNLSRGFVVDTDALALYLRTGKLKGAAIDVFPREPDNGEEFRSPLQGLPNTVLTPHIAGNTQEAQENIADFVSKKLIDFMQYGDTKLSVNLPNVELHSGFDSHRIVHIHHNVPGVIAGITSRFADRGINITGESLLTNGEIGYALFDVSSANDGVLCELQNVPGTIKVRVLY